MAMTDFGESRVSDTIVRLHGALGVSGLTRSEAAGFINRALRNINCFAMFYQLRYLEYSYASMILGSAIFQLEVSAETDDATLIASVRRDIRLAYDAVAFNT